MKDINIKDTKQNSETIKLGPRLHTIASYVPPGARLADIGTDHAYLPVYLVQKGIIAKAIGVDIHQGPYTAACQTVKDYGLDNKIEVRLGNGLAPLEPGEVDTLTIAGMGGVTILEILNSNPLVTQEVSALILQPQGAEHRVRRELLAEGWKMQEECLVEEDERIYTVMSFSRHNGFSRKEIEAKVAELSARYEGTINEPEISNIGLIQEIIWQLGPLILAQKENLLVRVIKKTIANYQRIMQEINKSKREDVRLQATNLKREIIVLEGILKELSL